jgi:hypothetical protein
VTELLRPDIRSVRPRRTNRSDCRNCGATGRPAAPVQLADHDTSPREMISRWMSDVPSSISSSLASRIHFCTGYSRE